MTKLNDSATVTLPSPTTVLVHGYVRLVAIMGSEDFICESARVSNDFASGDAERNKKLIAFLTSHQHTSPFEMCEVIFDLKMPIFVARQWLRHRTAHLQEFSQRYSNVHREFYIPDVGRFNFQGSKNRQVSGDVIPPQQATSMRNRMWHQCMAAFDLYEDLIKSGLSREKARIILPLNTFTTVRWKCDLLNTMKLLKLRLADDTQWETVQYAKMVVSHLWPTFPNVTEQWLGDLLQPS